MLSSISKPSFLLPPDQFRLIASYFNPVEILKLSRASVNVRALLTVAKEGQIMLVMSIMDHLDLHVEKQFVPQIDLKEMLILFITSISI